MKVDHIAYKETGYFSKMILDYLEGKESLQSFYGNPPSLDGIRKQIELRKRHQPDRSILVNALSEQHKTLDLNDKVKANIESLLDENTFTVTTGHQLSLFGGPLFFLYKIITTIKLCEKLNTEFSENNFVPIFWMASEDHDFEEINHIHLYNKKLTWEKPGSGAVGRMQTDSIGKVIAELEEVLSDSENDKKVISIFREAYASGKTLSAATRQLVNELFGEYGLVVLDADHHELKRSLQSTIEKDVYGSSITDQVLESTEELDKNYKTLVNPREINLFYLDDEIRGRIVSDNNGFSVKGTEIKFSKEEFDKLIKESPEKFSPNVVLRPVYQELILPNLIYVGGGGELSYWMQFKAMFDELEVAFPILWLRNSALVLGKSEMKKVNQLGLELTDVFQHKQELINRFVDENSKNELDLSSDINLLKEIMTQVSEKVKAVDPSLEGSAKAEMHKMQKGLYGLESKMKKAEKRKHEDSLSKIDTLFGKSFPSNSLQERHDNFIPFYSRHGKDFIKTLHQHLDPMLAKFTILVEE